MVCVVAVVVFVGAIVDALRSNFFVCAPNQLLIEVLLFHIYCVLVSASFQLCSSATENFILNQCQPNAFSLDDRMAKAICEI